MISVVNYRPEIALRDIQKRYIEEDYKIDQWYRTFIRSLDQLKGAHGFGELCALVENIYNNEYLGKLLPAWNMALKSEDVVLGIPLQRGFYKERVRNIKERVVVIISDAMRFDVGKTLAERLGQDPNSNVSVSALLSVLPSYTELGMAALLPHKTLEMTADYKVLVDGKITDDTAAKDAILKADQPHSSCLRFEDVNVRKLQLSFVVNSQVSKLFIFIITRLIPEVKR